MLRNTGILGGALLCLMGFSVTGASAATLNSIAYSGNDCSGVFGQGFENCTVSYDGEDLSPIIAKFDVIDPPSAPSSGTWSYNNGVDHFPTIDGTEFSVTYTTGLDDDDEVVVTGGNWTYSPVGDDPELKYWVLKQKNGFTLNWMTAVACADVNTLECLNAAQAMTSGSWNGDFSHISFYDTEGGGNEIPPQIPLPAALPLFGSALAVGGFASWRRRRRKAARLS